jgi:hypothetical protein
MAVVLLVPQAFATVYLIFTAVDRGWSTPAATISVSIVGVSTAILCGLCWAKWGNFATYMFWMSAGIYFALGLEARFGVAEALERKIGTILDW